MSYQQLSKSTIFCKYLKNYFIFSIQFCKKLPIYNLSCIFNKSNNGEPQILYTLYFFKQSFLKSLINVFYINIMFVLIFTLFILYISQIIVLATMEDQEIPLAQFYFKKQFKSSMSAHIFCITQVKIISS